jgi:hypothetical protein
MKISTLMCRVFEAASNAPPPAPIPHVAPLTIQDVVEVMAEYDIRQSVMEYLTDRVHGRPAQTIQGGSQPVRIEFSWSGTPEWMNQPRVEEATIQQVIGQIEEHIRE